MSQQMPASRSLAVSQQQAWVALNDAQALKACLAGCDRFEERGDGRYAVDLLVHAGQAPARFTGMVTLSDKTAPDSLRIAFDGQGGAGAAVKGWADLRLGPGPDDGAGLPQCVLSCGVQVQGPVQAGAAQAADGEAEDEARSMADDFLARFDALMRQRHPRAALPAHERPEPIEPTIDAQAWEHDAVGAVGSPLDAAPASQAQLRSRGAIPLWCWALALVVVLGAGWLLSRY